MKRVFATAMFVCVAAGNSATTYVIETVAGSNLAGDGGQAASASFASLEGVAVDSAGNIYVADAGDNRVRKIAPSGVISTLAGDGLAGARGDGGSAVSAQLHAPYGVAVDLAGNVYIADLGNHRVRRVDASGKISTVAGDAQPLSAPRNVAVDARGNLYIAEFEAHRITRISRDGTATVIAGTGEAGFAGDGGPANAAVLAYPAGIAVTREGAIYFADSGNNRIRRVVAGLITTVAGGDGEGPLAGQLSVPTGVALDNDAHLYIADSGNKCIRKINPDGSTETIEAAARDIATDGQNVYGAGWEHLWRMNAAGKAWIVAGDGLFGIRGDGAAAVAAGLGGPAALATDPFSNLYIADELADRVRRVDASGRISTIASADSAQLRAPSAVLADRFGNVWIADQNHDRVLQVGPDGTVIQFAGNGSPGFSGDGLEAAGAQLMSPGGLAAGADGALYIADTGNQRIRAVSRSGIIRTVAGNGMPGYSGDGAAAVEAQLHDPRGLAVDGAGNLYVADSGNHRIRRIDVHGAISTVAGTGTAGFSGDASKASAAQLNSPRGIAVGADGSLYIADTGNQRIRAVDSSGLIRTIAGTGIEGFFGDGGPALSAQLSSPSGIIAGADGSLWFADYGSARVRRLAPFGDEPPPIGDPPPGGEPLPPVVLTNAASMVPGAVAPGEIVSIFGSALGPETGTEGKFENAGVLATLVAGVEVRFDGHPASLFYVQASQINALVPYEVAGRSTVSVEVFYQGKAVAQSIASIVAAVPAIFTIAHGTGQAAAINQDGTLNSRDTPASRGSIVTLYATGEGVRHPGESLASPVLPVSLTIGGKRAEILYAGAAPGFAGLMQINARVPASPRGAGFYPVLLTVGSYTSPPAAVIALR
jgi:uncharacterized protein (TIGR03437 family)